MDQNNPMTPPAADFLILTSMSKSYALNTALD